MLTSCRFATYPGLYTNIFLASALPQTPGERAWLALSNAVLIDAETRLFHVSKGSFSHAENHSYHR